MGDAHPTSSLLLALHHGVISGADLPLRIVCYLRARLIATSISLDLGLQRVTGDVVGGSLVDGWTLYGDFVEIALANLCIAQVIQQQLIDLQSNGSVLLILLDLLLVHVVIRYSPSLLLVIQLWRGDMLLRVLPLHDTLANADVFVLLWLCLRWARCQPLHSSSRNIFSSTASRRF